MPIGQSKLGLFVVISAVWVASGAGCVARGGSIGAMLGQRGDGRLFVRDAPATLAASRHGLSEGDEILLIDGRDVRRMSEVDVHRALAGEEGTSVKITAIRGEAVVRVTLVRGAAQRVSGAAR